MTTPGRKLPNFFLWFCYNFLMKFAPFKFGRVRRRPPRTRVPEFGRSRGRPVRRSRVTGRFGDLLGRVLGQVCANSPSSSLSSRLYACYRQHINSDACYIYRRKRIVVVRVTGKKQKRRFCVFAFRSGILWFHCFRNKKYQHSLDLYVVILANHW